MSQSTTQQVSATEMLAEQNKVMLNIRGVISPEYGKFYEYFCGKNYGEITPEDIIKLRGVFEKETGLSLHCYGNVYNFNMTLGAITDEVKKGTFPPAIKHIMIGHGTGNAATKNWATSEGSVLRFINTNERMKDGDLVLVACCEDGLGTWNPNFPGRGLPVELALCSRFRNDAGRGPSKIVRRGEEIICGDYSLSDGLKLFRVAIG